jgi:acyl-CoA thioester hydrolase
MINGNDGKVYNLPMSEYRFYCPIQLRYGDLDSQGHVNNARYLTFTEQGRVDYLLKLGLWDGVSFIDLGLIVADVHISYLAPILFGQAIQVGVRVIRIGNKSLDFEYQIEDENTGQVMARCETVMVAYDYHLLASIPVPTAWRDIISAFEGLPGRIPSV